MQQNTTAQSGKMEMRKTRSRTKNSTVPTDEKESRSPVQQQNSNRAVLESDQQAIASPSKSSQNNGEATKQTSSSKNPPGQPKSQKQRSVIVKA